MPKRSAGLLLYRLNRDELRVLLAHPGGGYWARMDDGAWTLPKGEIEPGEDALTAARREFREELGHHPPAGPTIELGEVTQRSRKFVTAFALEGEFDPETLNSTIVEIEWPPRSGRRHSFPEIDRVAWFGIGEARRKILVGQRPILDRLVDALSREPR